MPNDKSTQEPSGEPIGQEPEAAQGAPDATSPAEAASAASPATTPETAATRALTAALAAHSGSTVEELARVAKIGHSTARKALLALEKAGAASRHLGGMKGSKLMPDRWQAGPLTVTRSKADEPATATLSATETGGVVDATPVTDGQEASPNPPSDEASSVAGPDVSELPTNEAIDGGKARLRPGKLHEKVRSYLLDHPGEELTPYVLGRAVGHSSGAVSNCCERLVAEGAIVETSQKPRRYRFAG